MADETATARAGRDVRRRAAIAARQVLAGTVGFVAWATEFGDHSDPDIAEVEDLLQHMPSRPWRVMRGSLRHYENCQAELETAIQRLEGAD